MQTATILIAGAGQAGFQAAVSLRQAGHEGRIILIGDESRAPYQRPPLSKAYFKDGVPERLMFPNADFYDKNRIELTLGQRIDHIDRAARSVTLSDARQIGYDHLVLALGARNRRPPIDGLHLDGVIELRTLADADDMRKRAASACHVVIIGGGFIGLEAASVFTAAGLRVTVLEAGGRLMGRAVSPMVSDYYLHIHRAAGVDIRLNQMARAVLGDDKGRVTGVELDCGTRIGCDAVLLAAGVLPNSELATAAGLQVGSGIITDSFMRTSDPAISAIGDVAAVPQGPGGAVLRLESVQAAVDQAKCLAQALMGRPQPYARTPWFWSDQGEHKLQIAGLSIGADHWEVSGSATDRKMIVRNFAGDQLICVETVNAPAIHMAARRDMDRALDPETAPV